MAHSHLRRGSVGYAVRIDGRECATTLPMNQGVVLFGPYEWREPGRWQVTWRLGLADDLPVAGDPSCAQVEVVTNHGARLLAERSLLLSELGRGLFPFTLEFVLEEPCELEYRVQATGHVSLDMLCEVEVVRPTNGIRG